MPTKAELHEDVRSVAAERDRYRETAAKLQVVLVDLLNSPDVKALANGPNYELGPAGPFTRRAIRKGWKTAKGEQ